MPKKTAAEPDSPVRTYVKALPCRLSTDELLARADSLAKTEEEFHEEESRFDDMKATAKARLSEVQARRLRLAIVVRRKEEVRDVRVNVRRVPGTNDVEEVREDTGETIERRPIHDFEAQKTLPGIPLEDSVSSSPGPKKVREFLAQ